MKYAQILFVILLFSAGASADSMRCGNYLIGNNSDKYEVLKKCGEPDSREGDIWVYTSSVKFGREVHFDFRGVVVRIVKIR